VPRNFTTYSPTVVPDSSSHPNNAGKVLPALMKRTNWMATSFRIMESGQNLRMRQKTRYVTPQKATGSTVCHQGRMRVLKASALLAHTFSAPPVWATPRCDQNLTSILVSLLTCALGMTTYTRILAKIGQAFLAQQGVALLGDPN
jgi:hypothetical protein